MTDLRIELADTITALIEPYEHAETYELRSPVPDGRPTQTIRVHRVTFPPLLVQLALAKEPSRSADAGARGGYSSQPAAAIAAIDRLLAIEASAAKWLLDLGGKLRATTVDNMRALVGMQPADDVTRLLVADAKRWLTWARVVTAWETPPISPRGTCPACETRGSLRVRFNPAYACCIECGAAWHEDDGGIALLAEHVRWCNNELETVA